MRNLFFLCLITISSICSISILNAQRTCQLYWTDVELNKISTARSDGSNVQDLITGESSAVAIRIDPINEKIYWGRNNIKNIRRSNLDGTNIQTIVASPNPTGFSLLTDIQIDVADGKIYWSDQGIAGAQPVIRRANLDGTDAETLIIGTQATSLDLDLVNRKMYYTTDTDIQSANLDGTGQISIVSEVGTKIFVDANNGKIYWKVGTLTFRRANLDGNMAENLFDLTGINIRDLTVDIIEGKIYWTNLTNKKIQRANLDGSMPEDIPVAILGNTPPAFAGIEIVCVEQTTTTLAPPIPTISQWGLLIVGLIILNLSIFVLNRKENLT